MNERMRMEDLGIWEQIEAACSRTVMVVSGVWCGVQAHFRSYGLVPS
jgi:hypothetical protein